MSHRRVTIRVEGVVPRDNYRQAARREAERLGISGFARNENDGSVTVEAEGEAAAIARFIEWCQHGPASASVDAIEVSDGLLVGYDGFTRR